MKGLNSFSASFADALFEAHPWLHDHAVVDPDPLADPGSLRIEFMPTFERPEGGLFISADAGRVTVGYGPWHGHYTWPWTPDLPSTANPLEGVRLLLEDRLLVCAGYRDGCYLVGLAVEEDELHLAMDYMPPGTDVHVMSFSGRRDHIIHRAAESGS